MQKATVTRVGPDYQRTKSMRSPWTTVLAGLVATLALFLLLPFAELLNSGKRKKLGIRDVTTAQLRIPPPKLEKLRAPPAPKRKRKAKTDQAKPKLELPKADLAKALRLPVSLDVGLGTFGGDFSVKFREAPGQASLADNTQKAETGVFELGDVDRPPVPVLRTAPVYPYAAKRKGVEGYAIVRFVVTAEGHVRNVSVLKSSPAKTFTQAAQEAVRRWRFEPGTKGGKAVAVRVQIRLRFELK
jgi:protein TonB